MFAVNMSVYFESHLPYLNINDVLTRVFYISLTKAKDVCTVNISVYFESLSYLNINYVLTRVYNIALTKANAVRTVNMSKYSNT